MDLEKLWKEAQRGTEILRARLNFLSTFHPTTLPYIFLSSSVVNLETTVVRRGQINVERPLIFLPPYYPQFEGFEFEKKYQTNEDEVRSFLLMRGVTLPSFKYGNKAYKLEIFEGKLEKAVRKFSEELEKKEDVETGLILGADDSWHFSLIIYVAELMKKSSPQDVRNWLKRYAR
jgi:hypothetical protein